MKPHRKRPARRKVAKKKAGVPATPGVGAGRVPPRASRPQSRSDYSASEGVSFVTVLMGVVAVALAALVVLIALPENLESKVDGYATVETSSESMRNLLPEMQEVAVDMGQSMEISEKDLNSYLAKRLQGEQKGTFAPIVKYSGTYVDLRPGVAEVFIERSLMGLPLTMSCEIKRGQDFQEREVWSMGGGSIGKLRMSDFSFGPILKPFLRISQTMIDDMDVLRAVADIDLQEGKVVLGRASS